MSSVAYAGSLLLLLLPHVTHAAAFSVPSAAMSCLLMRLPLLHCRRWAHQVPGVRVPLIDFPQRRLPDGKRKHGSSYSCMLLSAVEGKYVELTDARTRAGEP